MLPGLVFTLTVPCVTTFKITNYEGHDGTVLANVLVYRKKVVGGDICSAEIGGGFVQGFEKK